MSNRKTLFRAFALLMAANLLYEIFFPALAYALTSGPSQPEVQSFEPVGTTEMVDLSTGDFNYNIPLLDVEGYPINISYHAGIGMDQEASWVGLGWNINPGVINRNMRGLPDDFNGEAVTKRMNIKPNTTYGISTNVTVEVLGWGKSSVPDNSGGPPPTQSDTSTGFNNKLDLTLTLGVSYNNYKGVGLELGLMPSISVGQLSKIGGTASLGLSANSQEGFNLEPSVGLNYKTKLQELNDNDLNFKAGLNIATSVNSRSGLRKLTTSSQASASYDHKKPGNIKSKRTGSQTLAQSSSSINFGTQTYTPQLSLPMKSMNKSYSATVGFADVTFHANQRFTGFEGSVELAAKTSTKKAYGYLNTHMQTSDDCLLDFNREKDGQFAGSSSHLPIANYTYDLYAVSGQGIGALYRPYRSDISMLHSDRIGSSSESGSLGGEVGISSDIHVGANKGSNSSTSRSGLWSQDNELWRALGIGYDFTLANQPLYEAAYFKNVGEKTPVDADFYAIFGHDVPVRVAIRKGSDPLILNTVQNIPKIGPAVNLVSDVSYATAERALVKATGDESNSADIVALSANPWNNVRHKREKRNQMIQYLPAIEAEQVGLDKKIKSYAPANTAGVQSVKEINRRDNTVITGPRRAHHISEITALNPDGMRYVYGIPAYNLVQEEHTFNALASGVSCAKGLVSYDATMDSENNYAGTDDYFNAVTTPGHAHSYLLSAVLSPDYVDVTGNGVSFEDDLGTAVKINYYRHDSAFKWRTPYGDDQYQAYHNEGFKSNQEDDKGSYIFGKKEIWYVSSIESKNYIAEFSFSNREDGLGAYWIHGGKDPSETLLKLDKITLYARKDREINQEAAIPVKVVYFEYDYSLCPKVENNSGKNLDKNGTLLSGADTADASKNVNISKGKLTLKKLYFSYGRSQKAMLSPYRFYYASSSFSTSPESSLNPDYNIKAYDRWGNFKPNAQVDNCANIPNADFPYVEQKRSTADVYAAAWSLTRIDLPSGGRIEVSYEADDYAFVQQKKAMQMLKILGLGNAPPGEGAAPQYFNKLYPKAGEFNHYLYVYFQLHDSAKTSNDILHYFRDEYGFFPNLLYFNFLVDAKNAQQHYEYMRGYVELYKESNGIPVCGVTTTSGGQAIGYLRVKDVAIGDRQNGNDRVSPFTKNAWEFSRLHRPELVYPGSNPSATGESAMRGLLSAMGEVTTLWKSYNRTLNNKGYCQYIQAERSWIRLYHPTYKKLGGGLRVKKIALLDNWKGMNNNDSQVDNASYGQVYEYTKREAIPGTNQFKTISSGVAAYEPAAGNDENPWHQPIYTDVKKLMVPDERSYVEGPYGESFFPSPGIIYSQVTVKNLPHTNVSKHGTGRTVHEFYTARDFPTIVMPTNLKKLRDHFKKRLPVEVEDYLTASQGYLVELNDMHGKPKGQRVYAENSKGDNDFISGIRYEYQAEQLLDIENTPRRLNNRVRVFDRNNNRVTWADVATDLDFYVDAREEQSISTNGTTQVNADIVLKTSPIPIPIPSVWPSSTSEKTRFRSISATKVLYKFGVLKKTIAYENGASIETENVLYDSESGEVLLTRTQNEFKDSIFNFSYPAHFAYEGMGPAYKNTGATFHHARLYYDHIDLAGGLNPADYLLPGDEVLVTHWDPAYTYIAGYTRGWVHKTAYGNLFIMNRNGQAIGRSTDNYCQLKVIRSARRNLQNTPIGHIVSLKNPLAGDSIRFNASKQVLDAGATVFSDEWGKYCNPDAGPTNCFLDTITDPATIRQMLEYLINNGSINTPGLYSASHDWFLSSYFRHDLDSLCPDTGSYYFEVVHNTLPPDLSGNYALEWKIKLRKGSCYVTLGETDCYPFKELSFSIFKADSNRPWLDSMSYYHDSVETYRNILPEYWLDLPNVYFFKFKIKDTSNTEHNARNATGGDVFFNFCKRWKCVTICDTIQYSTINPYVHGLRGQWRKKKDFLYLTERNYKSSSISARKDGTYKQFNTFWNFDGNNKSWKSDTSRWTWSTEVSKYSPQGFEIENRDALNRYSAALYASNNLPVAVASNAKLKQIAFDGFEDLDYSLNSCILEHWNFKNDLPASASLVYSPNHSGRKALKINANSSHLAARKIFDCSAISPQSNDTLYLLKPCDCIDRFSPDTGYTYVLSGWLKEDVSASSTTYSGPTIKVKLIKSDSSISTFSFKASGLIIEGWQRVDSSFRVPYGTVAIQVLLETSSNAAWFDDLRLHPFDAGMKSYVYDPVSLKLLAELDENNFATFYEYDEQGALIRVKKETERGIMMLKESRSSSPKTP